MGTMKRGLLAAVASSLVLLTVAAVPVFGQELKDASDRPYKPVTAEMYNNPPRRNGAVPPYERRCGISAR